MALTAFLARIVDWLRAGYPHGVPDNDYVPLLALLARRLTEDEVREIAEELVAQGTLPADRTDVGVSITKITDAMPREADLARVREHLLAGGWPVDDNWPDIDNLP
ncbi:DUF3349 domain-containing protein [Nocardia blacklockiae]|uniref:DUF3349 domain-containing protein n=1 Tax=Nocardia blacklockiae TaxID=480036 RepID=UPI0018941D85|nr:DUF3349 domain-containing protein [Nocardia blacklockiae]MBF6172057.1 DUF3349 domain-containing protein [Nocardia blacklockiae]